MSAVFGRAKSDTFVDGEPILPKIWCQSITYYFGNYLEFSIFRNYLEAMMQIAVEMVAAIDINDDGM